MEGEAGKRSAKTATAKGITKSKKFTSFFTARITPSSSNDKSHSVELLGTVVEGSSSLLPMNELTVPQKLSLKADTEADHNRHINSKGFTSLDHNFQRNFRRRGKGLSQWKQLEEFPFDLKEYKDDPADITQSNISRDISAKRNSTIFKNDLETSTSDLVFNVDRNKVSLGDLESSKRPKGSRVPISNQAQEDSSNRESCHLETFKTDFKVELPKFFQLDEISIEEKPRKSNSEVFGSFVMAEVEKHDENVQQIKKPVAFKNKTVQTINQLPCNLSHCPTEKLLKILLIGDPGVGKTSFVQRYTNDIYKPDLKGTVGVDFSLKVIRVSRELTVKLQLWDIAGQERFTWMTRVYYKDAKGCVIFFDLANRPSFVNVLRWKRDLDSKCTLRDGTPIPCLLLANKCDLKDRVVDSNEIETIYKRHNFIGWTETSAKDDMMVRDSMKFLVDTILKKEASLGDINNSSMIGLRRHTSLVRLTGGESLKNKSCKVC